MDQWRPRPAPTAAATLTSLTTISPLRPDLEADVARRLLASLPVGVHSPFAVTPRTHFGRMQIVDELMSDRRRPLGGAVLVLSADVDGDAPSYLLELLDAAGTDLAPVLGLCAGAPSDPSAPDFARAATRYLLAHRVPATLHYVNTPGHTAVQVDRAVARHRRLAAFALAYQGAEPARLRSAFLDAFAPEAGVHR
jgi:hypothetical protein